MKRIVAFITTLLLASPALAQNVQQSGTVTARHPMYWVTSGVAGDPGGATDSAISGLGVTNEGGPGLCVSSQRASAAGRQQLCLSTGTSTGATITLTNLGTAPSAPLNFVVDGTTYPFPGSLANITIGVTPVVGGTTSNCLFVSGGVVGQQDCTLSAITSLTGDVTATGPGIAVATLATVNGNIGTFGSSSLVPIITVNGKGLITSVTTTAFGITVGSTVVNSGSNQGVLFNNGGLLGNLSTLGNSVLVASAGGVPSMATTLPTGLTIPSPIMTGTAIAPIIAGGSAAGASLTLESTSNGSPSGDSTNLFGTTITIGNSQNAAGTINIGNTAGGGITVNMANAGNGLNALNVFNSTGGKQVWVPGAGSGTTPGTTTWPVGTTTLAGLAIAETFTANQTFSGQLIETGTVLPAQAAGQTVVVGGASLGSLSTNGQAYYLNSTSQGAVVQGIGSANDFFLLNKSAGTVLSVPTGTTKLNFPNLSAGTCSSGLALDAGNNTILTSCPGAASSIQVGATTITSGSTGNIEFNNAGVLGEVTPQNGVAIVGTGLSRSETVNAQSGTSYAINNTDRGKLITASNTAAQAYTIAQAGTAGIFAAGYTTDIHNIQPATQTAAVVTVTPTTSTINGAASIQIYPGQSVRIVSDGTNYQTALASVLPVLNNTLGADVNLNNTATYFDGPSVAQGTSGTWFASGCVTVLDTASTAQINIKLYDGTTIFGSGAISVSAANIKGIACVSGMLSSPSGNIRIAAEDASATTGVIKFNVSGLSKDSYINVVRVQ